METHCISCKRYNANENSNALKTKQNRLMLLSNVLFVLRKNQLLSTFVKNQELSCD